ATALAVPVTAIGWGGEPLTLALPADDSHQLAAIPRPPDPPPVPNTLLPIPDEAVTPDEPESSEPAPPQPAVSAPSDTPVDVGSSLVEDPRGEPTVQLTPGIPVPAYPLVVNAQVEALMDYFTARERERFGLWIARSGRYLGMIQ